MWLFQAPWPRQSRCVLQAAALTLGSAAYSQTPNEIGAAAQRWLERDTITINFLPSTSQADFFEVDTRSGVTRFGRSTGYCFGGHVPTRVMFSDSELVFRFEMRTACGQIEYRFDPVQGGSCSNDAEQKLGCKPQRMSH
jgi:hypothetical protein